uniref:Uncharacterized protein n=1 Tax=Oryza brachyantha TaxID=4533 RepID=J3M0V1_ORYBR
MHEANVMIDMTVGAPQNINANSAFSLRNSHSHICSSFLKIFNFLRYWISQAWSFNIFMLLIASDVSSILSSFAFIIPACNLFWILVKGILQSIIMVVVAIPAKEPRPRFFQRIYVAREICIGIMKTMFTYHATLTILSISTPT